VSADDPTPPGPRSPHSLGLHVAVDTAIAFLAIVVLGLIIGVSIGVLIAAAIVAGCCVAPLTRRTEVRQLGARAEDDSTP